MGLDTAYACSCFGILKILEFIALLIAWACMVDATNRNYGGYYEYYGKKHGKRNGHYYYGGGRYGRTSRQKFFLGVTITAWILVIIWFCCYLFMLCGYLNFSNKMLIYAIIHLVFFILLLISGALIADDAANANCWSGNNYCDLIAVAAAFGLFAAVLFLIDAYMHWKGGGSGGCGNGSVGASGGGGGGKRTVKSKTVVTTTTRKV